MSRRRVNLRGVKSGLVTAIVPTEQRGRDGCVMWKCRCECGNEALYPSYMISTKRVASCGCRKEKGFEQPIYIRETGGYDNGDQG